MATQNAINNLLATPALTGTLAIGLFGSGVITYAKIQNVAATSILGNPTGSPAAASEITLGAGLAFAGSTIVASWAPPTMTVVSGTTQAAAVNNTYVSNNASLCTITLPATAAVGSIIGIRGLGAGGWSLAQNASQLIKFGNVATTTGTGGSIASQNQYDSITIECVVTNTTFVVSSSQGNMTVT